MRKFKAIQLQTMTTCNRSCPWCPHSNKTRQEHKMSWHRYTKLVDELKRIGFTGRFSPYLMNEPTLDDRMLKMVKYAKGLDIFINTNGTGKGADIIPKLIEANVEVRINCYDKIVWNRWKHLDQAVDMTKPKNRSKFYNRAGQVDINGKPIKMCNRIFKQMYIDYLGRALICCSDYDREVVMGDTREDSLLAIFNNEKYKKYREYHIRNERDKIGICSKCNYPVA